MGLNWSRGLSGLGQAMTQYGNQRLRDETYLERERERQAAWEKRLEGQRRYEQSMNPLVPANSTLTRGGIGTPQISGGPMAVPVMPEVPMINNPTDQALPFSDLRKLALAEYMQSMKPGWSAETDPWVQRQIWARQNPGEAEEAYSEDVRGTAYSTPSGADAAKNWWMKVDNPYPVPEGGGAAGGSGGYEDVGLDPLDEARVLKLLEGRQVLQQLLSSSGGWGGYQGGALAASMAGTPVTDYINQSDEARAVDLLKAGRVEGYKLKTRDVVLPNNKKGVEYYVEKKTDVPFGKGTLWLGGDKHDEVPFDAAEILRAAGEAAGAKKSGSRNMVEQRESWE